MWAVLLLLLSKLVSWDCTVTAFSRIQTRNQAVTAALSLNNNNDVPGDEARRLWIRSLVLSPTLSLLPRPAFAVDTPAHLSRSLAPASERVTVPLEWVPNLSAYVVRYYVGGERFGAIVDTGSPFLLVPSYCNRQKYGCFLPEQSRPSGLPPTTERFDNNQGRVEWRVAPFSFANAQGSMIRSTNEMVFGVLSETLMDGPGGVFLGLIRDTDQWIRPSFLGQTNTRAMEIDLRNDNTISHESLNDCPANIVTGMCGKSLTLFSESPLTHDDDFIPLVRDLNLKYGDPVLHYTAKASWFVANGEPVLPANDRRPIYVIFDTGVTGMVVSNELLDRRYAAARLNRQKSLWGTVQLSFETKRGEQIVLTANKPVTTPFGSTPWPKFKNAHLVVLGLAFLDGHTMVIDMDGQKLKVI